MKVDVAKIRSKLPAGCSIVGTPDYYESSYRGESIVFDVKMPKGKEKECIAAMKRNGFETDPNLAYSGGDIVEVEIPSEECYAFLNSEPVSSNPVVANALAFVN